MKKYTVIWGLLLNLSPGLITALCRLLKHIAAMALYNIQSITTDYWFSLFISASDRKHVTNDFSPSLGQKTHHFLPTTSIINPNFSHMVIWVVEFLTTYRIGSIWTPRFYFSKRVFDLRLPHKKSIKIAF